MMAIRSHHSWFPRPHGATPAPLLLGGAPAARRGTLRRARAWDGVSVLGAGDAAGGVAHVRTRPLSVHTGADGPSARGV